MIFDGQSKRITLTSGSLSVRALWTSYIDWLAIGDNSKYGEWMTAVGLDIQKIPLYILLHPGVAIVPMSANHTINVTDGVLDTIDGSDPFTDPVGAYTIRIAYQAPGVAIGFNSGTGIGTASEVRAALRAEIAAELARIDTPISSRQASGVVLANVKYVNDVPIIGAGIEGSDEWRRG